MSAGRAPRVESSVTHHPVYKPGFDFHVDSYKWNGLLASESHWKLRSGAWSGGGPFYCYKTSVDHGSALKLPLKVGFPGDWIYDDIYTCMGVAPGPTRVPPDLPSLAQSARDSAEHNLRNVYPSAYEQTRPGNPKASLGQFLIELKEFPSAIGTSAFGGRKALFKGLKDYPVKDLPRLLLERFKPLRAVGGEYLNIKFGWMPLVKDLREIYDLSQKIDGMIGQLIREGGRPIRRKAILKSSSETTHTSYDYPYAYANVYGSPPFLPDGGQTHYSVTTRESVKVWCSFQYQYDQPDAGSSLWNTRARHALYGSLPTPGLLWEVLPWSWLIDWFSNVGTIYSNLSPNAVDNLVTRRSYVMEEKTTETTYDAYVTHPGSNGFYVYPRVEHQFRTKVKVESKARLAGGNPFGASVDIPDHLTMGQALTLAALGITRAEIPIH